MKKFLFAAIAALFLSSCVCTECEMEGTEGMDSLDLYFVKNKIESNHVYNNGHVYTLYETPNTVLGAVHDPECVCNGGTHKDADTIQKYMEDRNISVDRFRDNGHVVVVFKAPHKCSSIVHDPECPCIKTSNENVETDVWNNEIQIDW